MADQVRQKEAAQYWPPEGTLTFQTIRSSFSSISFATSGDRKNLYGDALIAVKPAKACMQSMRISKSYLAAQKKSCHA